jgi:uncharacterized membrane protein HdeD (DUF308 family)
MIDTVVDQLVLAWRRGLAVLEDWWIYNVAGLIILAAGLLFLVAGVLLTMRGMRRAADAPPEGQAGGPPARREAPRGCALAVGVPLLLLGIVTLGWVVWAYVSV